MKLEILLQTEDIIAVHKPTQLPTHAPHPNSCGLVEILKEQLSCPSLGVHQRLDKETSGVVVFSKNRTGAKFLAKAFESRKLRKMYLAIVCGRPSDPIGQWNHRLLHQDHKTIEHPAGKQAKALYKSLESIDPFSLLELELQTGITHQLRVQCALAGFPILGDTLYGGGNLASRLYLHAHSITFEEKIPGTNIRKITAPPPNLLVKPSIESILYDILAKLPSIYPNNPEEAYRLFTPQSGGVPEVVLEKIGSTLLVRHLEPREESLWTEENMQKAMKIFQTFYESKNICYKIHSFPQKKSTKKCPWDSMTPNTLTEPLTATENGLRYLFDLSQGIATGLYLDQRENRAWVRAHAYGKVLNLFAYTCAFSLAAAAAGSNVETTSVDISQKSLNWGKQNFEQNGISTNNHHFFADDVFKFIKKSINNNKKFNMVICDPPTFGRAHGNAFQIESELEKLIGACLQLTAANGYLLFSVNNRNIKVETMRKAFEKSALCQNRILKKGEWMISENATGPLGVGTELKTCRIQLGN